MQPCLMGMIHVEKSGGTACAPPSPRSPARAPSRIGSPPAQRPASQAHAPALPKRCGEENNKRLGLSTQKALAVLKTEQTLSRVRAQRRRAPVARCLRKILQLGQRG